MFTRLLLAADKSVQSERAAHATVEFVQKMKNIQVTILHVRTEAPARYKLYATKFEVKPVLEQEAHHALKHIEQYFIANRIPYRFQVAFGDAASNILEVAEKDQYDLIVIGSRGLNVIGEIVLSSVSRKVMQHARCPVMIVK